MKVYRVDEHQLQKPSKLIKRIDGYEVTSNDGTVKIQLHQATVMDGSMNDSFYYTTMWIKEEEGWTKVRDTQSFKTKEDFLKSIMDSEDFTQACLEIGTH